MEQPLDRLDHHHGTGGNHQEAVHQGHHLGAAAITSPRLWKASPISASDPNRKPIVNGKAVSPLGRRMIIHPCNPEHDHGREQAVRSRATAVTKVSNSRLAAERGARARARRSGATSCSSSHRVPPSTGPAPAIR